MKRAALHGTVRQECVLYTTLLIDTCGALKKHSAEELKCGKHGNVEVDLYSVGCVVYFNFTYTNRAVLANYLYRLGSSRALSGSG